MDTLHNEECSQRSREEDNGADDRVNNCQEGSTCSSPLLAQQPHNLSNSTTPILNVKSFEYTCNSLELAEAEHLDPESISLREEESGLPLRSSFGKSGDDLLKEVDKNAPKKWSTSGVSKKGPGSDSGQGSETGTCSTVSDGDDSPNRSSQSSRNSSQGRGSRQMNYSHQDSVDSGRVSEGETGKESEKSSGAEKVIPVEVRESCLTDISEKSVEQDSSVEIPVSVENEPGKTTKERLI